MSGINTMFGVEIPKEIICQVSTTSKVPSIMFPVPVIFQIVEQCALDTEIGSSSRSHWPREELLEISHDARSDLAHMRLVNKIFCECATPLLFQDIKACFPWRSKIGRSWRPPRPSSWSGKILKFSEASGLVYCVKRMEIGFSSQDMPPWDLIRGFVMEVLNALPTLVFSCEGLRELVIRGSAQTKHGQSVLDQEEQLIWHRCIDQVLRVLGQSKDSPRLRGLSLSLDLAYHFGERLGKSSVWHLESGIDPLACVLESLHRLEVSIVDRTGRGGMRYGSKKESGEHTRHPNREYQDLLWKFMGSAKNLRSLTVNCTHVLGFDRLCISGLRSLHDFRLMRVTISEIQPRKLVEQNRTSLEAMQLDMVDLDSGTWESIMLLLYTVSRLQHLYIDLCGYTASETSSHHALSWVPEPDRPQNIETFRDRDVFALGHVQRHVNAVRTKAKLITDIDYRYLDYATLGEEFWASERLA